MYNKGVQIFWQEGHVISLTLCQGRENDLHFKFEYINIFDYIRDIIRLASGLNGGVLLKATLRLAKSHIRSQSQSLDTPAIYNETVSLVGF